MCWAYIHRRVTSATYVLHTQAQDVLSNTSGISKMIIYMLKGTEPKIRGYLKKTTKKSHPSMHAYIHIYIYYAHIYM